MKRLQEAIDSLNTHDLRIVIRVGREDASFLLIRHPDKILLSASKPGGVKTREWEYDEKGVMAGNEERIKIVQDFLEGNLSGLGLK